MLREILHEHIYGLRQVHFDLLVWFDRLWVAFNGLPMVVLHSVVCLFLVDLVTKFLGFSLSRFFSPVR